MTWINSAWFILLRSFPAFRSIIPYGKLRKDRQDAFNAVQVLVSKIIASKPSLSTENEAFRSGAKKP